MNNLINFWNILSCIKTRFYKKKRSINNRIVIKNKFQRVNLKKGLIKSKSTQLLVTFKLQLTQSLLLNSAPLSNILNLYGINSQKLCEDISKDLNFLNITDFNFVINLYLFKDLSYKYLLLGFKTTHLIKMFYVNLSKIMLLRINMLTNINFAKRIYDNLILDNLRNYYLTDFFFLYKYIYLTQFKFYNFNFELNMYKNLNSFLGVYSLPEMFINNNKSILKSLNILLKTFKFKKVKNDFH